MVETMTSKSPFEINWPLTKFFFCFSIIYLAMICRFSRSPHCSYLDIYISLKIRLCVVNLEGNFQTNLQAKLLNFLVWKFRSIILNFPLFFAGFVKSSAFCNLSLLFQRVKIFELWFVIRSKNATDTYWPS